MEAMGSLGEGGPGVANSEETTTKMAKRKSLQVMKMTTKMLKKTKKVMKMRMWKAKTQTLLELSMTL